jgi:hypothetical protein
MNKEQLTQMSNGLINFLFICIFFGICIFIILSLEKHLNNDILGISLAIVLGLSFYSSIYFITKAFVSKFKWGRTASIFSLLLCYLWFPLLYKVAYPAGLDLFGFCIVIFFFCFLPSIIEIIVFKAKRVI